MEKRNLQKKIYRVILGDRDYFIYAHTKQGAVRDVMDYLKDGALCRQATGEDMYNLGARLGSVLGHSGDAVEDSRQHRLDLDEPSQFPEVAEAAKDQLPY